MGVQGSRFGVFVFRRVSYGMLRVDLTAYNIGV